jgi:predicted nicotinamide N-methyase
MELHGGNATIVERIDLGERTLTITRPRDTEALFDDYLFEENEFLPYWAELWPSGIALARYVTGLDLAGKGVLELGCGLGLPALVAALGGANVLATDWAAEALTLLERNAKANRATLATRLVRWDGADALGGLVFDVVLAADVLYEERNADPLLQLLGQAVAPEGEALVADPGRSHSTAFLEQATDLWQLETIAVPSLPHGAIHRLRREATV